MKNLKIGHPDQVWQTDIVYIPMLLGFMYMNAIIDVHSRKILNRSISNSMDKEWCIELLKDTIAKYGTPGMHNSDQGTQYTSAQYIEVLKKMMSKYQWMVEEGHWTTFIQNAFGNRSNL